MRICALTLCLCLQATAAFADDISPWFGSADQKPFRIDLATTDTSPSDLTATNSTEPPNQKAACEIAGCPKDVKTVNTTEGQTGLSQN
jgi:hypothetical protein